MTSEVLPPAGSVRMNLAITSLAILSFFTSAMGLSLPYNPTSIFLSPIYADLAYVFLTSSSSPAQCQLATINISTTLQSSNISPKILSARLPFDAGDNDTNTTAYLPYMSAYLPYMSASGSIGVYSGSCNESPSFWIFNPDDKITGASNTNGNGTWAEKSMIPSASISATTLTNANFLAAAFSFSTVINSNDTQRSVYTFGGMCPISASNVSNWQSSASYSNNMLKISPPVDPKNSYDLSVTASVWNKPIPEAGFTITGLTPTYSNTSAGMVPQAQNFVLVGGHTKAAFTNMSLVAVFSLPQEVWSFQTVDSPANGAGTELAVKSAAPQTPDSRSGHTAVLNTDGTAIIVFGGWVGDVNTPADPQLAILRLGSGFGGSGDWQWEIPKTSGSGLSTGEGIYGHGAVMLPGHVMMIVGGNMISASSSRKVKRAESGSQTLFLNVSSLSWVSEYTNPLYDGGGSGSSTSPSNSSKTNNAKKVGLGAGLGLGIAAVIGALIVYFLYARRLKRRRRQARERDLQALSQSAAYSMHHSTGKTGARRESWWEGVRGGEMAQGDGRIFGSTSTNLGNRSMNGGSSNNLTYGPLTYIPSTGSGEYENEVSRGAIQNALGRIGSIPRKPVTTRNTRGCYQPAPNPALNDSWGHNRANTLGTAGPIHPIYEADEDLEDHDCTILHASNDGEQAVRPYSGQEVDEALVAGQVMFNRVSAALRHSTTSDPFRDPSPVKSSTSSRPGTSHSQNHDRGEPFLGTDAQDREREIKEWVADWAAADALMNSRSRANSLQSGRLSPTKESYGRTESNLSEKSLATVSAVGLSRNSSQRSNGLTAFFAGSGGSWNPFSIGGSTALGLGSINENGHRNGDVSPVSNHSSVGKPPTSSGSGTSSFTTAQTTLSFPQIRAEAQTLLPRPQEYPYISDEPGSPSKSKTARRQPPSWLGTLKRVFSSSEGEQYVVGSGSSRSSPQRDRSSSMARSPTEVSYGALGAVAAGAEPRRTVSASAMLWRRKQGPEDWEDSVDPGERDERRSNTLTLQGTRISLEEEWDIERAIERRVVQVMFTVPKEKLRVVNADFEAEDKSDTGSLMQTESEKEKEGDNEKATVKLRETEVIQVEPVTVEKPAPPSPSPSKPGSPGKAKGRVQEIVEKMESGSF